MHSEHADKYDCHVFCHIERYDITPSRKTSLRHFAWPTYAMDVHRPSAHSKLDVRPIVGDDLAILDKEPLRIPLWNLGGNLHLRLLRYPKRLSLVVVAGVDEALLSGHRGGLVIVDLVRIDLAFDQIAPVSVATLEDVLNEGDVLVPFADDWDETFVATSQFVVLHVLDDQLLRRSRNLAERKAHGKPVSISLNDSWTVLFHILVSCRN